MTIVGFSVDIAESVAPRETHHITPVADEGETSLRNQLRLCGHHHDLITHRGYTLTGDHHTRWHLRAPGGVPPPDTG